MVHQRSISISIYTSCLFCRPSDIKYTIWSWRVSLQSTLSVTIFIFKRNSSSHQKIIINSIYVDDSAIGTSCLGLKNLALSEICYFAPVESLDSSLFNRLEALELWSVVGVALPTLLIKQLLNGCQNIRNLLFRYCESVTDSLLTELWTVRSRLTLYPSSLPWAPTWQLSKLSLHLTSRRVLPFPTLLLILLCFVDSCRSTQWRPYHT